MALEIAAVGDVIGRAEHLAILWPERVQHLGPRPDVELALLALAVGVKRSGEPAALRDHLALEPANRLVDASGQQRAFRLAPHLRHQVDQQRVVVEHLLEVRHQPALVDRVAREAAADVIVDAALADAVERQCDGALGVRIGVADRAAPEQPEHVPLWELRRAAEAAVDGVDRAHEPRRDVGQQRVVDIDPRARMALRRQRADDRLGIAGDLVRLLAIDPRHLAKHVPKRRLAVARRRWKVRAAPERTRVGIEEHGQRPAAVLGKAVQRRHVDGVDVGALLAVDFDVDEQLVHHRRGGGVLEALVRHHVAPVAGGIANRQQDRPAAPLGLRQCLGSPRPPVDRVVLVLQEIGAHLAAEAVHGRRGSRGWCDGLRVAESG